ncbi:MAG: hypothetical protein P8012_08070 [Desulfobacterales bacterium]
MRNKTKRNRKPRTGGLADQFGTSHNGRGAAVEAEHAVRNGHDKTVYDLVALILVADLVRFKYFER